MPIDGDYNRMIICDFDGVLFDGEKFKKDYSSIFAGFGISARAYSAAYRKGKSHPKGFHHALTRRFAEKLDIHVFPARMEALLKKSPRYLYSDAKDFLRKCLKEKITLVLVSTGPAFQKRKITTSGIAHFFKKVVVIRDASKAAAIKKIIRAFPKERVIFVDDTAEVVDGVKREVRSIFAIQMIRRRGKKKSATADAAARNFKDVTKILGKNLPA